MSADFNFKYSLKERQEIEEIRKKYTDGEEHKEKTVADKIKTLDRSTETSATILAILFGLVFFAIFCVALVKIFYDQIFISGSISMLIGLLGMILCPAFHKIILKYFREKTASKILRLIDEYLNMTK